MSHFLPFKCKFLEIQFNQSSQPDGGKIYTFLLEKVSQFYDFSNALLLNCHFALVFHYYALRLVKYVAPLSLSIRGKTKTSRKAFIHFFWHFVSATCI